jgi:hypothetical protein
MEGFKNLLSERESAILEEAYQEAEKFRQRLAFAAPAVEKGAFARMGTKRGVEVFSANLHDDITTFKNLTKAANHYYKELKGAMNQEKSTHEFITAQALAFLEIDDRGFCDALKEYCMEPDRSKDKWELAYEGHFYGKVGNRRFGNFFPRVFPGTVLWMLDRVNDIDETAASNFSKYFEMAFQDRGNLAALGSAAHYLQDLTAPHHAGNMAIFFEILTDGANSHHVFEKFACDYVYRNSGFFSQTVKPWFDHFQGLFDPLKPEKLAKSVYSEAVINVPKVKTNNEVSWEEAVKSAIPVAIGATAVILEAWK